MVEAAELGDFCDRAVVDNLTPGGGSTNAAPPKPEASNSEAPRAAGGPACRSPGPPHEEKFR